ncbi:MAG TPA: TIGR03617 family F420-dependent LLM class oxidoreductase [Marmoricola sp.]|nr:TIGR03617 family F420-dependent LLM class oxidoreductase [Marmoricola sp.]HNI70475.1 TIGR03617 family F420-dependent LLM class oxidoreductase [Marmoricola sp.]
MSSPRFDVSFHGTPDRAATMARMVEERGDVAGLFTPEGSHDPMITLALAAAATDRIQIGSGIALAFARTPMVTAYSAWDLQQLSGGRFILGLGSQIKPHITRRYSMPWSRPAARMEEYVAALRAIWDSWQHDTKLDFRGDFYQHTLMPPLFRPAPLPTPPQVWVAGVGPRMVTAAGRVADGLLCHPLISRSYLSEVLAPAAATGRRTGEAAERPFTLATMAMVAAGRNEAELARAITGTRQQIGFYASTPAYKPVLEHHGLGELYDVAHSLTLEGRWSELADAVDNDVLNTFAVVGEISEVGPALRERFSGVADRVTLSLPYPADDELALDVIRAAQAQ